MRDVLCDMAFGISLVATGLFVTWFAATLGSPVMGAIGAVFAVVGAVAVGLQMSATDEGDDHEPADDEIASVSLSSAPDFVREDLPPSSKLVWMYLTAAGGATLDDIVSGTQLTPRTARNAITRLEKYDAISKRPASRGSRQIRYDVRTSVGETDADGGDDRRSAMEA